MSRTHLRSDEQPNELPLPGLRVHRLQPTSPQLRTLQSRAPSEHGVLRAGTRSAEATGREGWRIAHRHQKRSLHCLVTSSWVRLGSLSTQVLRVAALTSVAMTDAAASEHRSSTGTRRMSELQLKDYAVTDKTIWFGMVIAFSVAVFRLWEIIRIAGMSPAVAYLVTALVALGLWVAKGLRRQSSLLLDGPALKVATTLFGWPVNHKVRAIADAAWVRARIIGNHAQVAVEVGTAGFTTTELVRLPYRLGRGVPKAEALCALVAEALKLPNKGFKGMA